MADDTNWRDKVKSPSKINEKMIGGENTLPKKEGNKIDSSKMKAPEQTEKKFDRKEWKKGQQDAQKRIDQNLEKQKQLSSKVPKFKAPISKGTALKKGLGKAIGKFIPYLGVGITAKEGYDFVKEQLEEIQSQEPLQEQLQKLHEEDPEKLPEPPTIEAKDDVSSIPAEEKEGIMLAMRDVDKEKPDFLKNIEPEIEHQSPVFELEIKEELPSIPAEEKENIMMQMRDIEEMEKPEFLKELESEIEFDPPDFGMDAPSMDSNDSSDSGDSGSDGGGDGD